MTEFSFPAPASFTSGSPELELLFERSPTTDELATIKRRIPGHLKDKVVADGIYFCLRIDPGNRDMEEFISEAEVATEGAYDNRWGRATQAAFNEAEEWLSGVEVICPIRVAHRKGLPGIHENEEWHRWSIANLAPVLDDLDVDQLPQKSHDMLRKLLSNLPASVADRHPLADFLEPGRLELKAIAAGDSEGLRAALESRTDRWDETLIAMASSAGYSDKRHRTIAQAFDLFEDREWVGNIGMVMARALGFVEQSVRGRVVAKVAEYCHQSKLAANAVGAVAYELVTKGDFEEGLLIYDVLVEIDDLNVIHYNNAIWAVMDEVSGLGVQPERARRYLKAGVRYGSENPPLFHNAACAYFELGELDEVFANLALALEHGYDPSHIKSDDQLASLRETDEFRALFAR